ncbi:hypothetical protein C1J03_04040 [Sulfitobacter sp. SK012]|nr:hypothetical protein C1J03_04040 [Sulfitobacter sp. SK012]
MRGLASDMVFKIVILFLVFMGVLGWFGKMHWIGGKTLSQKKCRGCGRYRIGKGTCSCGERRG